MRSALTLCAASALLTGCMNLAPAHERPVAPIPATFPNPAAPASATPLDRRWQSYFSDPTLRSLIETALANNRDLRIAVLNVDAVRAQFDLRRADLLPTVNVGANASRQPGSGGNMNNSYSAGFSVSSYELDLFGRLRSLSDSAAAQLLASEHARDAAQIALVAAVANQYLAIVADDELLDLTQRTLQTREASLKLTQLKFDHGAASELDLRLAVTLVEAGRVTQAQTSRQRELDRNALALLLGQALPELPAGPGRLAALSFADLPSGLPAEVLLRRPDVNQAEQQLIAAEASIGAARAAFWPRIALTTNVGTASSELSKLFQDGVWTYAAQLLLPIFDAGRNRANLAVAQVQRDIAIAQYQRAIQSAFRDVADALAGRATLDEQLRAARAQAEAERVRHELVELRFRNGASSSLDVLDAQRSLFSVQQLLLQTQAALLQNRVTLYRSLGGGLTAP